jgi:hypothetical protein
MIEERTKLFATRTERYPQPDDVDATRGALEKLVEQVPLLGAVTVHVIAQFLVPGLERRREQWFKELADDFDRLKQMVEGFSVENLAQNEAFVSATIQATRIAIGTHKQEKRELLRNALLNVAIGIAPEDDLQQSFLRYIEDFSVSHVRVLQFLAQPIEQLRRGPNSLTFNSYRHFIQAVFPNFSYQPDFLRQIFQDLHSRGLLTLRDPEDSLSVTRVVTAHGYGFLTLVSQPEALREKD